MGGAWAGIPCVAGAPVPPAGGAAEATVPAGVAGAMAPVPPAAGVLPGPAGVAEAGTPVAGSASLGVPGATCPGAPEGTAWPGRTRVATPMAAAAAGRATTGVARGTGTGGTWGAACCTRAAAPALTRCSNSAARSGARPAHSRKRFSSRAWEKTSSERIAMASRAANAATAPTWVNEFESENASGKGVMNLGSV